MTTTLITKQESFDDLCETILRAGTVAFDTEFVSENTYRPELGLLQFATQEKCVAVDPYAVQDLSRWWDLMADSETTIVVHGGQAEIRFCLYHQGRRPRNLVDVQLAEGFRSRSYPLAYSALVSRVLGKRSRGKETRTDWTRRPLSQRQIDYALEDVRHLLPIWKRQQKALTQLGRLEWFRSECERLIDDAVEEINRETWVRLPGINRLSPRELGVIRELADWRDQEARRSNRPLRRVLRDDLIVELGKRQPGTMKELMETRDMNRSGYRKFTSQFLQCIERGQEMQKSELPTPPSSEQTDKSIDEQVLSKFLGLALSNRCRAC
ncbi:MAG: HRDC domain-containing protein, partial [Planctomycetes bacterium]|nr:HRDC domain-containing protein [Planctomycetota bacterium]